MPARPPAVPLAALLLAAAVGVPATAQDVPPVVVGNAFFETVDAVDLAAERPGMLRSVPFREGDRVEVDEVVAELWDEVPRAQLATLELQAEDTISEEYALKAAQVAQAELRSLTNANARKSGVVPAADLDRARLSLAQAKAQILKARQERELAKLRAAELRAELQSFVIAAPFSGVVQRVQHLPGESVRQGDPILHLVNTDRLRVVANVPMEQVLLIRVGDLATAQPVSADPQTGPVPLPLPPAAGRVTFVDPTEILRDGQSRVRVFVEIPNPAGVYRAGLSALVTVRPGTAALPDAGGAATDAAETADLGGDLLGDLVPPAGERSAASSERTARFRPGGHESADRADVPRTRRYAADPAGR